jgi:hypothetical protein
VQQRQLRLGDILDDYCPRERRVTNHAVVAMVGDVVKQTRCATCETEHEYKHAKVPRQRRKDTPAALYAQVLASGPKRVAHEGATSNGGDTPDRTPLEEAADAPPTAGGDVVAVAGRADGDQTPVPGAEPVNDDGVGRKDVGDVEREEERDEEEGPVHRPLIRASLPRIEGQQPPARPIPEFTIRQPGGRPNRFRPRPPYGGGGGQQFQGNRSNGGNLPGGPRGGGGMRSNSGGGRPPQGGMPSRLARRHGPRKRTK